MNSEVEFEGFRIDEVLSRSSTTSVYRAFQHSLQRPVLIKELRPELFQDEDLRERFEREARACARIKHENIVDIYELSSSSERIFLVMEFIDGCSLANLIHEHSPLPINLVSALIMQTLRGLACAHSQGVVHRDMKPENILISRDGWVKISDFGLARFEGISSVTRAGTVVGTPAYLSPEAISGGKVGPASDIFSLGVTFYQAFTGENPFHAEHFSDSLNKVLSVNPKKLSLVRDDVPVDFDRILQKMLEKQVSKRWNACEDIINELGKIDAVVALGPPKFEVLKFWGKPDDQDYRTPTESVDVSIIGKSAKKKPFVWIGLSVSIALFILLYWSGIFQGKQKDEISQSVANNSSLAAMVVDTAYSKADSVEDFPGMKSLKNSDENLPVEEEESIDDDIVVSGDRITIVEKIEPEEVSTVNLQKQVDVPVEGEPVDEDSQSEMLISELVIPDVPARVFIQCDPWADVYVDEVLKGKTPLDYVQIDPGEHQLVFRHPQFAPAVRNVELKPGEDLVLKINFWESVGRIVILVDSWAEVYVDGNYIDVTPLKEPLVVPLGTTTITLKNPASPIWEEKIRFHKGDPPCTLRVNLKPYDG
ncbi:hypothetical protein CEE37_11360 [candidate division LCP-89 bacterium B3_LCP]|uniref:Protein kinase domain-containing protein n=1 Tax=candidate division LCP-89 bacterium B3_LCP TaxID=2012998 RepID=A0A532UVQ3_UNCL8|nr:MAG: hypothetical protein CEE37_11360 [candidate division LCP-89 bacterium B3_LCP]